MAKYKLVHSDGREEIVDIEPLEQNEADRLQEQIDDQRHKFAEQDSLMGRVLMRLDAAEKQLAAIVRQDSRALD